MYEGQDDIRKEALEVIGEANSLMAKTQQALKDAGKTMDKAEKKQIKKELNNLQKIVSKTKVDKVQQIDVDNLCQAKAQLEISAGRLLDNFH